MAVPLQISAGEYVPSTMVTFDGLVDGLEHLAVTFGDALDQTRPLVRIHSECLTGDVFGSARCDCRAQLQESLAIMYRAGGILLYLRQEGRGIGLYNKMAAYRLQESGMDTFEANRALNFADDLRDYAVAAQMLIGLGVRRIELLSNNPKKAERLEQCGIAVVRQRRTAVHVTDANRNYLRAKVKYAGHLFRVD
ncbi:GTP cyclohydrolase II [Actinophytocola sp.]|uniref:GTP cyclohydrolase II n=1 Tax=Actinophytocola sp. TaxID=1872138 RepID=UPI002DB8AA88|nr:GTP cyclohydrolase II [Actinophytocola sp.]